MTSADVPRRRIGRPGLVVLVAVPLLVVEWMVVSAAVSALLLWSAQHGVAQARSDAKHGAVSAALADGHAVQRKTSAARTLLGGPLWSAVDGLPGVRPARDLIASVDDLSHTTLPPLIDAAALLKGPALRRPDGGIQLSSLTRAGADVRQAQGRLDAAEAGVRGIHAGVLGFGQRKVLSAMASLRRDLRSAQAATAIGPAMLGADGPRYYVLLSQNTAELRGTGGLIGSYAEVVADHGALTLVRSGSDDDLHSSADPVPVSPDFDATWDGTAQDWRLVNESPDFPSVAMAVTELWHREFGEKLDGVIAITPEVAADVTRSSGPLHLSNGVTVSGDELVTYLQRDIYLAYPAASQQPERKQVLVDLQRQLFDRVRHGDSGSLLGALVRAEAGGAIKIWSAHPSEQSVLAGTLLGGRLPSKPGPFAAVVLNNAAGNKTDAFLTSSVSWRAGSCVGATRTSTLELTVRNTIAGRYLSPYLAGTAGVFVAGTPKGQSYSYLSVYGSVGATDPVMTIDGHRTTPVSYTERGHPIVATYVTTDPGQRHTIRVTWTEPSAGAVQPLLLPALMIPPDVHVAMPACRQSS